MNIFATKKIIIACLLITSASMFCSVRAATKDVKPKVDVPFIELKGIRLGMISDEVYAILGNAKISTFTIGGVGSDDGLNPTQNYIDDKLASFFFSFRSSDFEGVILAVRSKYPMTQCVTSEVKNRMGATFPQVECQLSAKDGSLSLRKYGRTLNTGNLFLLSSELREQRTQEAAKKSGDI